jgi:O-antigen/teichoic acid export membrane protein
MLKKLARHSTSYSLGNLLVMLSGFVSFPIFTRIFSVEEYGMLNLVSATLPLLIGISKLGVQNAIVRYYGEARLAVGGLGLQRLRSTTLLGMLGSSLVVTLVWVAFCLIVPASQWSDPRVRGLLLLTSVLVVVQTVDSCLINFVRAEQRSGLFSSYAVTRRYVSLAVVLATLFYVSRSLYGLYAATILTDASAVLLLFVYLGHARDYSPRHFDPDLFRKMLAFGVPLIAYELAAVMLNIGDRYVIEALLGSGPLGEYSAAYNLCDYVRAVAFVSVAQAIAPMYVSSWGERGEAETRRFVQEALRYLLMLAVPVVAGLAAVGGDLLALLASEKYRHGATVIPWVTAGMGIDAAVAIVGAGLFIHKRTATLAGLVAGCAVLNIGLNLVLVPRYGILGAGIATFLSYAALTVAVQRASAKAMPVAFPWRDALKFMLLAGVMYLVVVELPVGHSPVSLVARIMSGVLVYGLLILAVDAKARAALRLAREWMRRGRRG